MIEEIEGFFHRIITREYATAWFDTKEEAEQAPYIYYWDARKHGWFPIKKEKLL